MEPAVKRAAKPEIYGCTVVESDCFVILGTCESGGRVVAKSGGQTVSSRSDHGYFSIRLERTSSSMRVELTVQVSGKEDSEALSYNAVPKSVSAEQWALIAGADYQFHIQYTLADYRRTNSYSASALGKHPPASRIAAGEHPQRFAGNGGALPARPVARDGLSRVDAVEIQAARQAQPA